jgi:hypothetical protein
MVKLKTNISILCGGMLLASISAAKSPKPESPNIILVNLIRTRAKKGVSTDLPNFAGLSQDQFRTAVLDERRFELAFEGQRAWDLKRRGLFLQKLSSEGKSVQEFMLLIPIPDNQIELNKNLV